MSYADRASLKTDPTFHGRLDAAVLNEALLKPPDPFVDHILSTPNYGMETFLPLIISLPGFDRPQSDITDPDILAGVQASWSRAQELATS